MQVDEPILIDVLTFCRLTGLGKTKAYELIRDHQIATIKLGRSRKIYLASVKQLLGITSEISEPILESGRLPCSPIDKPILPR